MSNTTIEMRIQLSNDLAHKLRDTAHARGIAESAIVEQALDLFFSLAEPLTLSDYWFSAATMREDWDAMPADWMAEVVEVSDALPAR